MLFNKKMMVLPAILIGIAGILSSCSKEQISLTDEEVLPDESILRQPSPGNYSVFKFIDTGDDETSQFTGYVFEFQADGDLIATTNTGAVFTGFWDLNSAETMMEISIAGTDALEDLDDDDWTVNRITNSRIGIFAPGPDRVIFQRIP